MPEPLAAPLPAPLLLPKGFGFRVPSVEELRQRGPGHVFDLLTVWEPPRRSGPRRYVIGVDVSNGMGLDRHAAEVLRVGTIEEPAEQVAEFISDTISPTDLAFILQAIGMWYADADGVEALMAIESNLGPGMSTQDMLQLHLGYANFYRWEYYDAADPSSRFSTRIGWATTPRTRPILLTKFHAALTTLDPVTLQPDLVTHSAFLHDELTDFVTDGALWEAEAARGAHDDCTIATAIAYYTSWRLQGGETEPLEERRRRRSEQIATLAAAAGPGAKPDWRNTPATAAEMGRLVGQEGDIPDLDEQLYDPRSSDESFGSFGW